MADGGHVVGVQPPNVGDIPVWHHNDAKARAMIAVECCARRGANLALVGTCTAVCRRSLRGWFCRRLTTSIERARKNLSGANWSNAVSKVVSRMDPSTWR